MIDPTPDIEACERRVWEALLRGDKAADEQLLHRQFIGVYPDGFADRDAHTGQLASGPTISSYALEQIKTIWLGPEHALISYRATFTRPGRDTAEVMYVSSIWRRSGEGWVNIFSQDTPAA